MNFKEFLQHHIVSFDGGMGTLLQAHGLTAGELPENWNITQPAVIRSIHRAYFEAGCHVVSTNTFGANALKFSETALKQVVAAAVDNAKAARTDTDTQFVALDIGPSGKLLKPLGDLDFEDAVELFAKTVRLGVQNGVDLILIETMNDCYETKAAVLAAKENSDLPIVVTNAYGEDGKLMTGATPAAMVAMLEGMGVDALGANCSLGPTQLRPIVKALLDTASVPVVVQPNAGLPRVQDGKTVYDVTPADFAGVMAQMVKDGVRVVGGCCGTTPAYIKATWDMVGDIAPTAIQPKMQTVVSSYTHAVTFGGKPLLIGERINPTGKKRFRQALAENDMDYILNEGITQQDKGVDILDVNVGTPDIDEADMLTRTVDALQAVVNVPLQIDTADAVSMEKALRRYNGKALINSVNGKAESMHAVFPLQKKYGGVVIALTLDESGIPATVEGRLSIAERILDTAAAYGIDKRDIVFDPLAMTVSTDPKAATVTLETVKRLRTDFGVHTSLGVSNVSFGLPNRDAINSTFFALALANGLSAAIMNPFSADMMKTYYACCALTGLDENCANYIENIPALATVSAAPTVAAAVQQGASDLQNAIIKGMKHKAGELTKAYLETQAPLAVINAQIIPALNIVGEGFEKKTVYLPQLLMSAEAAKSAFAVIKSAAAADTATKGTPFVLATVKGDIHDIGKNIVKLLLENYGFYVIDLGRDVPPETVVQAVKDSGAALVGLSALMTTTLPAMAQTVALLQQEAPHCQVVVGGAVLTSAFAEAIGAVYAKDAMETVRFAEQYR